MKVIRQGIVLWAQFTQDALGVLIDVLEPDWGMPAAVETVDPPETSDERAERIERAAQDLAEGTWSPVSHPGDAGYARPGTW